MSKARVEMVAKRISMGYKQYELAEVLDISNTYLSDIEKGRKRPSFKLAIKISRVLDLDIRMFIEKEEQANTA